VDSEALNFFLPFRRLELHHENQLTRALLVVLRYSPLAHAAWLRLAVPGRELYQLAAAVFRTQTRAVRYAEDTDEPADLVSVFLTPEAPLTGGAVLTESDRTQVLDAVIDYGGELLVVVENKVAEDDDLQARELNTTGARVRLADGQEAVVVLWRDVIEALIALRERHLVAGAEALLLDDFLTYVEDYFPALGPFRTLGLARGNRYRQHRRLRQLLGEATGLDAVIDGYGPLVAASAGAGIGERAYLWVADDDEHVELALFPADTLAQAREFYTRPSAVDGLNRLREQPGWDATPNFHFGYITSGFCWTKTGLTVDEYVEFWIREVVDAGAVAREEWDEYWAWLVAERIADPGDRAEFDAYLDGTRRDRATPRPGLGLARHWSLAEAEALDRRGALHAQVRGALDAALTAFGGSPLPAAPRVR
jgi:hypothetical protein